LSLSVLKYDSQSLIEREEKWVERARVNQLRVESLNHADDGDSAGVPLGYNE
jgi:hypothetical protein